MDTYLFTYHTAPGLFLINQLFIFMEISPLSTTSSMWSWRRVHVDQLLWVLDQTHVKPGGRRYWRITSDHTSQWETITLDANTGEKISYIFKENMYEYNKFYTYTYAYIND